MATEREDDWFISVCVSLAVAFAVCAFAQSAPPNKTQLEANTKRLVAEGRALEDRGKLAEADAAGRLLVCEARRLYQVCRESGPAAPRTRGPAGNPDFEQNMAMGYLKLGDRANADLYLEMAAAGISGDNETRKMLELASAILVGTPQPGSFDDQPASVQVYDTSYRQKDRDANDPKAPGGSLCQQATGLKTAFPLNPAVVLKLIARAERQAWSWRAVVDYERRSDRWEGICWGNQRGTLSIPQSSQDGSRSFRFLAVALVVQYRWKAVQFERISSEKRRFLTVRVFQE